MDRSKLDAQALDSPALLAGELQKIEQEVSASLIGLRPPFSQLVQSQVRRSAPMLCGAFVLTAGVGATGEPHLIQQRIYLGAAIEVLRLALAVHTHLLEATNSSQQIDRSVLGSTVLAGDFCFSRSAGLAAKTGSPVVVDIFAQALQHVSEGTLRGLFNTGDPALPAFDAERELCLSGVAAANELAGLNATEREIDHQLALLLLNHRQNAVAQQPHAALASLPPALLAMLPPHRAQRWEQLRALLYAPA